MFVITGTEVNSKGPNPERGSGQKSGTNRTDEVLGTGPVGTSGHARAGLSVAGLCRIWLCLYHLEPCASILQLPNQGHVKISFITSRTGQDGAVEERIILLSLQ